MVGQRRKQKETWPWHYAMLFFLTVTTNTRLFHAALLFTLKWRVLWLSCQWMSSLAAFCTDTTKLTFSYNKVRQRSGSSGSAFKLDLCDYPCGSLLTQDILWFHTTEEIKLSLSHQLLVPQFIPIPPTFQLWPISDCKSLKCKPCFMWGYSSSQNTSKVRLIPQQHWHSDAQRGRGIILLVAVLLEPFAGLWCLSAFSPG